jgi:hypothetical protein
MQSYQSLNPRSSGTLSAMGKWYDGIWVTSLNPRSSGTLSAMSSMQTTVLNLSLNPRSSGTLSAIPPLTVSGQDAIFQAAFCEPINFLIRKRQN